MGKLAKGGGLPDVPKRKPDKIEIYAGKHTARKTETYKQPDGSEVKATVKINKDNSVSKKIEYRQK